MKVTEFALEAMLVRWAETSNGGATIVLQLADVDDLEIFKSMTLKSGNKAGQRLAIGAALIGDDEKKVPIEVPDKTAEASPLRQMAAAADAAAAKAERTPSHSHFPPGLTGLAVMWCSDPDFQQWAWDTFSEDRVDDMPRKEWVKEIILSNCEISSRKELDTSANAAKIFRAVFKDPYRLHKGLPL